MTRPSTPTIDRGMRVNMRVRLFVAAMLMILVVASAANASPVFPEEVRPGLTDERIQKTLILQLDSIRSTMAGQDARSSYMGVEFGFDHAYRVFNLLNPDLVAEFEKTGSLADCISSDYLWKIPLVSQGVTHAVATLTQVGESDWEIGSFGTKTREEEYAMMGDQHRLADALARLGFKNLAVVKAVALPMYHTSILYVQADEVEYALLLSPARFTNLKVHKVYGAEELVTALKSAHSTNTAGDNNSNSGAGSTPSRPALLQVIGSFLVVGGLFWYTHRAHAVKPQ